MNQLNTRTKAIGRRIAVLTMLVLVVAMCLSGCVGNKKAAAKQLTPQSIPAQAEGGNLSVGQLNGIVGMLVSAYDDVEFDVQDRLIAASRGYDMQAVDFKDADVDPTQLGTGDPVAIAKNLIKVANDRAEDAKKISADFYENLNEQDLNLLVWAFQTTVDVTGGEGVIANILKGIGKMINFLSFGRYYIIGICLFAIIVELLMLPFAIKQQKNTIQQAKLRPKEMAIRNKYKGRTDQVTQQKIQKEIQELYERENFSPFSGCLQLFLQLPIILALYQIVIDPLHYVLGMAPGVSTALTSYYTAARAAGGLGGTLASGSGSIEMLSKIGNLQGFQGIESFLYYTEGNGTQIWNVVNAVKELPNFNIFNINFGLNPDIQRPDWLLIVPVLTFLVYFFSMRLSRKFSYQPVQQEGGTDRQTACSNTMMDVSMPAMSTFFAFMVPGVIGVYWMFRSVIGTLKQFIISRIMPMPQFTEEDYKAAAREMAGRAPKRVEKSERAGRVRSLHHIDDEDFADTRERALAQKAAMEEEQRRLQAERAEKTPFAAPEMKEEPKKDAPARKKGKKKKTEQAAPVEETSEETVEETVEETAEETTETAIEVETAATETTEESKENDTTAEETDGEEKN